jgi:hypothetical protein
MIPPQALRRSRYLKTSSNQSNSIWCLRLGLLIWQCASPRSAEMTTRSVFGQVSFSKNSWAVAFADGPSPSPPIYKSRHVIFPSSPARV